MKLGLKSTSALPLILALGAATLAPAARADTVVKTGAAGANGANGTMGSPMGMAGGPGESVFATAPSATDMTQPNESAVAIGGKGGFGGYGYLVGMPGEFPGGNGGIGGDATALATGTGFFFMPTVAYGSATAIGGEGGDTTGTAVGGKGGDALAIADELAPGEISSVAQATGGKGGSRITGGVGNGGDGGTATASAYGRSTAGHDVSVQVLQSGGNGGDVNVGVAGSGASSFLTNAAAGLTTGQLTLQQSAQAGRGGIGGTAGQAGSAGSALTLTDTDASRIVTVISADGGRAGGSQSSATNYDGGSATSALHLTAAASNGAFSGVSAVGGDAFSLISSGLNYSGAAGGNASATASVVNTGKVEIQIGATGGKGGNAVGAGQFGGAGGHATLSAFGQSLNGGIVNILSTAQGGSAGGSSGFAMDPAATPAAGTDEILVNAIAGSTTGSLGLSQRAYGGAAGYSQTGGGTAGIGSSTLNIVDTMAGLVYVSAEGRGGTGGGANFAINGSRGGTGTGIVDLTSSAVAGATAFARGDGGGGFYSGVQYLSGGGDGTASATVTNTHSGGNADATAYAVGSTGTTTGTATANATANALDTGLAIARATASGNSASTETATATVTGGVVVASAGAAGQFIASQVQAVAGATTGDANAAALAGGGAANQMGANSAYSTVIADDGSAPFNAMAPAPFSRVVGVGYMATHTAVAGAYTLSSDFQFTGNGYGLTVQLLGPTLTGTGFTSGNFQISVNGVTQVSTPFFSAASAASYFNNNILTFGNAAYNGMVDLRLTFSVVNTLMTDGGFGFSYLAGQSLTANLIDSLRLASEINAGTIAPIFRGGTLQIDLPDTLLPQNFTINNQTATIDTNGNTGTISGVISDEVGSSGGKLVKTGPGTLALAGNNSFSGGIDLMTGTLSLRSDNAAGTGPITTFGSVIDYGNGVTIATPIVINSNTTQLRVLTGLATQNGVISEMMGPRPLEKIGAGELVLGGNNSFSGQFTISAGTIGINAVNALGTGNVAMAAGTAVQAIQSVVVGNTFSLTGLDTFDTQGFDLILNNSISGTGSINKIGSGRLLLYGNSSYSGGTALNAGQLLIDTNTALGTGTLTMQNGTRFGPLSSGLVVANQVVVNGVSEISSGTGTFRLNGQISGPGTLNKTNSGTLILGNGTNTHGGTTISDGTLAIFADGALGAASAPLTFAGASTLQMLANVDVFRPVVLNAAATIDTQGFDGSVSGGFITGAGSLTKTGTGRLTLNGTDDYTGGTFLNQGTLRIESGGGLGSGVLTTTGGTTFTAGTFNNATINLPSAIVLGAGTTTLDIVGTTAIQVYATDTYNSNGTTLGLNGGISGAGALNVVGTGKVTFAGNNSYAGGTTVAEALVAVTNGNSLGSGALTLNGNSGLRHNAPGTVTLNNAVAFNGSENTVGGSGDLNLAGTITGAAKLDKVGTGTLNLTGTATGFTGNTDVVAGRLLINTVFGAGGGQALNVLGGATLGGAGTINANVTVGGGAIYAPGNSPGTIIVNGNLSFLNNAIINYDLGQASVIGGAFNDQTTVNGNLSFAANSTLNVTDSLAFGLGVYNLFTYTGTLTGTGPNTVNLPGGFSGFVQAAVPGFVNLIVAMPGALVQYWDGADMVGNGVIDGGTGTWNNSNTNWTTPAPSVLNSTWQGGIAVFQGAAGTVTLTANESFQGLQFSTTGYAITATGTGGLTANGATFIATDPGVFATISAPIGGTGSILKQNTGTLLLDGANTYTGGTTVSAGTLQVGSNTALGTGLLTLQNGTTLAAAANGLLIANAVQTNGIGTVNSGPGVFTLGGTIGGAGSILKAGAGNLVLNGNNTYNGLDIASGTVTVGTNTAGGIGNININGGSTLAAGANGLVLANTVTTTGVGTVNSGAGVFTLNGVISGAGSIVKTGAGNLVLNGANTYNGLDISAGTVTVGTNTAGGIGNINIGGGSTLAAGANGLVLANTVTTTGVGTVNSGPGVFTLNGVISGAGSILKTGAGNLVLNGANSYNGLDISAGTVTVGTNTAGGIGNININGGSTLAAGVPGLVLANTVTTTGIGTVDSGPVMFTLNGTISGAGSIRKTSAGNLVLNGNNSYNGLDITAGTVTVGTNTAGGIGNINIGDGTILAAGANGLVLANTITTPGSGRVNSGPGIFTLNGTISGAGSISQIGTGNLVLNGNNSFAGGLGINLGTVTVGTNTAAGTGSIAINDGTILAAGVDGLVLANNIQSTGSGRIDTQAFTFELDGQIGGPGSISKLGSGNLLLKGNNSFVNLGINQGAVTVFTNTAAGIGSIAINDGTILRAGVTGLVLANNIQSTGSGRIDTQAFTFELDGQIGGPGSISKLGSGNLLLKGNNNFVNLGINQGIVTVFTNTAAGIGSIAINDGTILAAGADGLVLANNIQSTGSGRIDTQAFTFELDGQIGGPGSISKIGSGNLLLKGNNNFVNLGINQGIVTVFTNTAAGIGAIALNDGTILAAGVSGLVLANSIQSTGSGRINSGSGMFTLNGQIGGPGSISQIGTGNLVLNGNNTFVNLGINQGTVTVGTNTAAGLGGIAINDGAILAAGVSGLVLANNIVTTGGGRVNSGPGVFTLNGQIGGAGSISQIGTGNLVLNGNNNFSGGLGINLGTVTLGTNTAAGTGNIAINDGTILAAGVSGLVVANGVTTTGGGRVNSGPGIFTLNGQIGGAGSISQIGTGNLVLNGNNSFAGGLGINQGTVTVGSDTAAGTGAIAINDGAILAAATIAAPGAPAGLSGFTLDGTITGNNPFGTGIFPLNLYGLTLNGNNAFAGLGGAPTVITLANNIVTTGGGRVNSGAGTLVLNGIIGGAGSISQIGTGNLVLNGNNAFAGGLGINRGQVTLGTNTAAGSGAITINNGAILAAGVSGLVVANHVETTGGGRVNSGPGVFTLNGSIGGAGSISQIGTGNLVLNGNNSFAAGLGINQGTVTLGTNTAAGTGAITINNGAILAAGVSGLMVANQVETTGGGRVDSGPGVFTLNGNIGGAGSISQIGTGTLVLNGNNSFAAGLGINLGQVTLGTNTAAGTGAITINNGAILAAGVSGLMVANQVETTGGGRVDSGPGVFTLNGNIGGAGSISQIGTGTLVLNGNNSFAGGLGINQGAVEVGTNTAAGTGTVTINDGATLIGDAGVVLANHVETTGNGLVKTGTATFTLNGTVGGAGSLTYLGGGILVLNGANDFAGGLRINNGQVTLGTGTSAGTGGITIATSGILAAGVTGLTVANAVTTTGGARIDSGPGVFTLTGVIGGAGSISQIGTGNLVLNAANTFSAGLGINQGQVTLGTSTSAGTGTITINNGGILAAGVSGLTIANGIQTTGGGRVNSGTGTLTLNGVIGNTGSISQIGTGNLILNGANTFAGGLGVNIGTVTLGTNTAAGTGTIALNAATLAAGVSGLTVANNIQSTGGGRIDSGTGTFTLSGQFQNSGGFTKAGTGNLILTGSSSAFTGGVAAAAGRLTVNGSLGSTVTVQSGATLAGGGSIGGLVASAGSTVSPGAPEGTVGTLTVTGNASFASGSTYLVTVSGATSDRIAVGGTASLGGANLSVTGGSNPAVFGTTYTVLTATGGRTGTFTPVFGGFGQAFNPTLIYGANDVRLTLAPASIAGLLGGGANGSRNIANFAAAFDASVAAGFNPQAFFPIFLQSGAALGASLNSLTGEITSANSRTAIADTRYIRDAALDRLQAQLGDGSNGRGDQVASAGDGDHSVSVWLQGVGSWTDSDGDGNGSRLNIDAKGVVTGIDASFGNWKVGGLFNYIDSKVDTSLLGRGKVASTGGGLYAGYRGDSGFAFGAGGAVSHVRSTENRTVIAPIAQSLRSRTSGTVYQAFGEISYDLAAAANTRIEPFVRAAYVSYHVDATGEAGGFAALNIAKGKYDSTVITGGLRGSVLLGGSAWLKGSAGYQYTTGDRSPVSLVSIAGTSGQAAIRAVPLDKSAFAGALGIDFRITPAITLGAGYNGVIGKNTQDHGARATLTIGF